MGIAAEAAAPVSGLSAAVCTVTSARRHGGEETSNRSLESGLGDARRGAGGGEEGGGLQASVRV